MSVLAAGDTIFGGGPSTAGGSGFWKTFYREFTPAEMLTLPAAPIQVLPPPENPEASYIFSHYFLSRPDGATMMISHSNPSTFYWVLTTDLTEITGQDPANPGLGKWITGGSHGNGPSAYDVITWNSGDILPGGEYTYFDIIANKVGRKGHPMYLVADGPLSRFPTNIVGNLGFGLVYTTNDIFSV